MLVAIRDLVIAAKITSSNESCKCSKETKKLSHSKSGKCLFHSIQRDCLWNEEILKNLAHEVEIGHFDI